MFARAFAFAAGLAATAGFASAQTGRYYVTDENLPVGSVYTVSGGNVVNQWNTLSGLPHGPIAVGPNTVRTTESTFGGNGPVPGEKRSLAGVPQAPISLDATNVGPGRIIDGAYDGRQSTYVVSGFDIFGGTGEVWRFGADFDGPGAFMFRAGVNDQGITYDCLTDTIWTSEYNLTSGAVGLVKQWDLAGNLLFAFPVTNPTSPFGPVDSERNTALAYDPLDDTFWLNAHVEDSLGLGLGELWQFDRNGNFLQAVNPRPGVLYWGGEFNKIPAPGVATLLGLGGLAALRRRRA